jgi:dGTPase
VLKPGRDASQLPEALARFEWDLELASHAGPEAQIAALSDDIAYMNHDIDDGLRAGLFSVDEICDVPLAGPMFAKARGGERPELGRLIGEAVRDIIGRMVTDVVDETRGRLAAAKVASAADIRALSVPVVAFSAELRPEMVALKSFLYRRMYRHERVAGVMARAQNLLTELFGAYMADPALLPAEWTESCGAGASARARAVCDYIAGMTDGFAQQEYQRIFGTDYRL